VSFRFINAGRTMAIGFALATIGCSSGDSQPTLPNKDKLFVGCKAPIPAPGGRTITEFIHAEDREGRLRMLGFAVSDPNVPPSINGNSSTLYRAQPISPSGADLVRRNVKQPGKPSYYIGMSEADQSAMHGAVFGTRAIRFDAVADYGKLSEKKDVFITDNLLFLEPGWAVGVIVPLEKVHLAPKFRASAAAALNTLLQIQKGCSTPQKLP
jgi:hypothetical protein